MGVLGLVQLVLNKCIRKPQNVYFLSVSNNVLIRITVDPAKNIVYTSLIPDCYFREGYTL